MADKRIDELPTAEFMSDDALLAVWQDEETRRIAGAVLRSFSEGAAAGEISARFAAMTIETGEPGTEAMYDPATNTLTIPRGDTGKSGSGTGDMQTEVYDPQGKSQDIFAYVDNAVTAREEAMLPIRLATYEVTNDTTNSITFDLSGVDLSRYVKLTLLGVVPTAGSSSRVVMLRINGDSVSGDYGYGSWSALNNTGTLESWSYAVAGRTYPWGGGTCIQADLLNAHDNLLILTNTAACDFDDDHNFDEGGVLMDKNVPCMWRKGALKDVRELNLLYGVTASNLQAFQQGTKFLLCGWKF